MSIATITTTSLPGGRRRFEVSIMHRRLNTEVARRTFEGSVGALPHALKWAQSHGPTEITLDGMQVAPGEPISDAIINRLAGGPKPGPAPVVPFPVCSPEDAVAAGYAEFNHNPHLCVDVPDGNFTITAKTSDGRRITFAFLPDQNGAPPACVDIQYHDRGTVRHNGKRTIPTFDTIIFNGPRGDAYDSRTAHPDPEKKPGIICVFMDKAT